MFAVATRAPRIRDSAGARARRLGALRPLHRRDIRVSGRRARRSARADPRARAMDRRRQPAGSHVPFRRAAARLPRAARSRAQRRARSRSLRGRGRGILRSSPRRLPRPRGRGAAPLLRDRQLAAARRRARRARRGARLRSSTCDGGRTRRRAGDASLAGVAAMAARGGAGGARAALDMAPCAARARAPRHRQARARPQPRAGAVVRNAARRRSRVRAVRKLPLRGCRRASGSDAARAADDRSSRRCVDGGGYDHHRPHSRAHRVRPADEPPPAREGRGDCARRQDERRRGERIAEDAGGAPARHLPHPRHRTARARSADDPLPLPKARCAAGVCRKRRARGLRNRASRRRSSRLRRPEARRWRRSRARTLPCKANAAHGSPRCRARQSSRRPGLPHGSRQEDAKSARRGSRTRWIG